MKAKKSEALAWMDSQEISFSTIKHLFQNSFP
jgi:hypothetical protein